MKNNTIYKFLLMLCFLGIFGSVQADDVYVKIDFARVQDANDDNPKTAACIVVWVDDDVEEKVFCRYQLEKNESFLRDNTEVNKILGNRNQLIPATPTSFPAKINSWLTEIERDLSIKILPASTSRSKIAPLFAEFVKQGVKDKYNRYPGYDVVLFENDKPYNLFLPRQTIDVDKLSDNMFAFLAHNEVHRVVSETKIPPKPVFESQSETRVSPPKPPKNPEIVKWVETLDKNSPIHKLLTNETSRAVLEKYAEVLKGSEITEKLENIKTNKPLQTISITISTNQMIMVILAIVIGILLLLFVIFWTSGSSQNRMDNLIEDSGNLSRQIKAVTTTISKTPIDSETNKQLIAKITNIIRQQITVDEIVTKVARNVSEQNMGIKRDILTVIKTEREQLKQLAQTKDKLTQTQSELVEVQKREERMHESLESLMLRRFRVVKPAEIPIENLLAQLTRQGGTWQWYQQVLSSQYEACANAIKEVQALNNPEYKKITKLLNIENILRHWRDFILENPHFESDEKLLERMFAINGGTWLSNVFRADDLLKTYFADIPELESLATRLGITAMMLEAALQELGVKVIKPTLLEKPSVNLPESASKPASNRLLMELTHKEVMSKLSDNEPQLVVDIAKYGFITPKNPKPDMTILYADLAGWEGY